MPLTDPIRSTPPLSPDFPSAIDALLPALQVIWRNAFGYRLEDWQVDLLRRVTEQYPAGHPRAGELRFRQVLVSVARQNGKSEIASALGIWGLLRASNQYVVGIARTAEQARIVYKRALTAVGANPALKKRMSKMTDTRGLETRDGSLYELKASNAAALQGLPVALAVVDEVHLLAEVLWDALSAGTGGRPDALLVGITTAGDDGSDLLKRLYDAAEGSFEDPDTRLGAFIWEAETDQVPDDDAELLRLLRQANPALASGRLDADNVLSDVRSLPKVDIQRYRLNRFTSSTNKFMSLSDWRACATREPFPTGRVSFGVDVSPGMGAASIVAATRGPDGFTHTELVASWPKPTHDQLVAVCLALSRQNPITFGMDNYTLKDVARDLKAKGLPVETTALTDIANASSLFYSKVMGRKVKHDDQPIYRLQVPATLRKSVNEGFRIVRKGGFEIDAVMAEAIAIWLAETRKEVPAQLFL